MNQEQQVTVRIQKVKKNRIWMKLIVFAGLAAALLLITIFAKYICPYDPYAQDLTQAMQPPSAAHLMGTDTYGRDMLSRVLIGAQTSISSTFALVAIITVFGTVCWLGYTELFSFSRLKLLFLLLGTKVSSA